MTWQERTKVHEGFRNKPYVDTVGKTTIGWGHNLTDRGISPSIAEAMFQEDCQAAMMDVGREMVWVMGLDDARKGVLYEMCFQLGISRLMGFKNMLAACHAKDYITAAAEMLNSKWASEDSPTRAINLATIMKDGLT